MILRAMGLGFVLWLINAALFRFLGQTFFYPGIAPPLLLFAVVAVIGGVTGFILLRVLREAPGDEGEAALGVALPSLLLNAFLCYAFVSVFPNLDPALDGIYGAMGMVYAGAIGFVGLMLTRLAPEDERI